MASRAATVAYLRKRATCGRAVERLDERAKSKETCAIDLVVDNSAVAHVIRRGLSTNPHATEMLCRLNQVVPLERIRVHQVLSEDNAADPLTRGKSLDERRNLASQGVVRQSLNGWPKVAMTTRPRPTSHEEDLEYEWDEELDALLDVADDVSTDPDSMQRCPPEGPYVV